MLQGQKEVIHTLNHKENRFSKVKSGFFMKA